MAYKSSSRPTAKNPIKQENWDTLRVLHQIAKKKTKEEGYGTGIGALSDKRFLKKVIGPMMRGKKLSRSNEDIREAVDLWFSNRDAAKEQYGDISLWDVSRVTNMRMLFFSRYTFNDNITQWDVSNVEDMNAMFSYAESFNQPIGNWNVSKVKDMNAMFSTAVSFNQYIGGWDVSNVKDMSHMFYRANVFNQPIGNWNVSKVENMGGMFSHAFAFNENIGQWNVSNVNNMIMMFNNATAFNKDLSGWDTGWNNGTREVKYFDMFKNCNINPNYRPRFWWSSGGAKKSRRARMRASRKGTRSRKGRRTLKRGSRRTRRR